MQKKSNELGALISKLQLGDDEMSIETYIQMKGEEIIKLKFIFDELVDATLGTNYLQDFNLNVDLDSVNVVDDVAPPTIKLSDDERHASLLSRLSLENSLYSGVNKIISSQKIIGILDKMIVANLGRQHNRYLDSYFKSS